MAQMDSTVLDVLLSLVQPRSAEARITSSAETQPLLSSMTEKPDPQAMGQVYQAIVNAAQQHPSTIDIQQGQNLPQQGITESTRSLYSHPISGDQPDTIQLTNIKPSWANQASLAHELLHFLFTQENNKALTSEAQHAGIRYMLGAVPPGTKQSVQSFQQPYMDPYNSPSNTSTMLSTLLKLFGAQGLARVIQSTFSPAQWQYSKSGNLQRR